MIGFEEGKKHLDYGMISLPEGKMKSREGKVVDADDLIEEIENLAYSEVKKRYPALSEDQKKYRAEIISLAALKFYILKFNPKSDFVFNPEDSISFEGETGPYVQYCYARIQSIISKSNELIDLKVNYNRLKHELELKLIKQLNIFPYIFKSTIDNDALHLIPQNLLTLCQIFNSFYAKCPVISEDKELEKARLLLIKCVQIVIKKGLNILGIETLDKM
jgi:arginyl-tRNA synthetase